MAMTVDDNDRRTLEYIVRNPGCKRTATWVVKAAVTRLINTGLVAQPSTNGKLYATTAGKAAVGGSCEV